MVRVGMTQKYHIERADFVILQRDTRVSLHEVTKSIAREPSIDQDTNDLILLVSYFDTEFGVSEWMDEHRRVKSNIQFKESKRKTDSTLFQKREKSK